MVRFFVKNLQRKYRAKVVQSANKNIPYGKAKPDFELWINNKRVFFDVGISENMHTYYQHKVEKYKDEGYECIPLIF